MEDRNAFRGGEDRKGTVHDFTPIQPYSNKKEHFPKKHIKERCFTISKTKIKTTLLHCKLFSYICNLNISYTIDKRNKSAKKNAA